MAIYRQLKISLLLIILINLLSHVHGFSFAAVDCDPSIVGQTSAKLYVQVTVGTTIPANGRLVVILPSEVSISTGTLSCQITGDLTISSVPCSASTSQMLSITLTQQVSSGRTIQVTVASGFKTPGSTAVTSSFTITSYQTNGITVIETISTGITLTVSANTLTSQSASLTTSSQVGQTSTLRVNIVNKNSLPSGSIITITFPKWNTDATSTSQLAMISNPTTVSCAGITNVNQAATCSFNTATDTLTLSNAFPSGLTAGSSISFSISTVRVPLSFAPVSIYIQTATSGGAGIIDTGSATISANVPASILSSTCVASAEDATVQELTNFKFEFQSPVPLSSGTVVTVVFPAQFTFDTKLTAVQGYGLFGSIRNLKFTADQSQRSIKITNGIESYRNANIAGKLVFQQLYNPDYVDQTDTFSVYLSDSNGFQIAQVTTGIFYTPVVGDVQSVSVSADSYEINAQTKLYVNFSPVHQLSTFSKIVITLPSNIYASCTGISSDGSLNQNTLECNEDSTSVFSITGMFASDYTTQKVLTLIFTDFRQPFSVQPVSGIIVKTYERVSESGSLNSYIVDSYESSSTLYTLSSTSFIAQLVETNTTRTYSPALFTFTMVLESGIPSGGYLKLTLPSEVSVFSNSITCKGITNMASSLTCTRSTVSGQTVITITQGFTTAVAAEKTIKFTVATLRTPETSKTSSSFALQSLDKDSFIIDSISSLMTVTMLNGFSVTSMTAQSDSNVVAANTSVSLSLKMPVPFSNKDLLYITIPKEIQAPTQGSLTCTGSDGLNTNQPCTVTGQTVLVTLSSKSSTNAANTQITVKIRLVTNPLSTKPTSEFSIILRDSDGYLMAQSAQGNGAKITVGTPAVISNASLSVLDSRQFALTTVTVRITNVNPVPAGGYLKVTFDKVYFVFDNQDDVVCTSSIVQNVTCEFQSGAEIHIKKIFLQELQAGTTFTFTVNNCYLDVSKKMTTESWSVTTMTSDDYQIDKINKGLTLSFPCDSPCQSCLTSNPNYCLSCNILSGSYILFNNKCYSKCPDGYYLDAYVQCQPCNTRCKTCKPDNPDFCLSCNTISPYPFLEGNTCIDQCPYGQYQNSRTAKCENCATQCGSCSGSSTNCTNCNPNSVYKFTYGNTCLTQCPSGTTLANGTDDRECQKCSSNCFECKDSIDYCTSCQSPKLLSEYDNTCQNLCPFGWTVYNSTLKVCQRCDSQCNTCANRTTFCTSCAEGLFLNQQTGQCVGSCASNNKLVGVNGVCTGCSSNCLTCIGSPDKCLTCAKNKHFYDFSCVSSCPSGYEVDSNNQCVIIGLRCPFGQKVNAAGNGCELKAQVCENGFRLNPGRDKCIPGPGSYVPFPLIYACVFLCLLVLGSWIKFKETRIATNCIAAISFIESVGIIVQVILAYDIGIYSTFGLSLVALLFGYGSNMFFCLIFLKQVSTDQAFKYWSQTYSRTHNAALIVGGLINFKIFRVIYGRFFGKDCFNAAFDEQEAFFKPFTFISVFSILTTMVPILVANIIGLVFIEFGYQIQMNCIEMTIIELVLLGLMIYEKIKMKKIVLKQTAYYKMDPKLLDQTDNVMSSIMDQEREITKFYSLTTQIQNQQKQQKNPQFKEYFERRRHLEQLISTIVSKNATTKKEETTVQHIQKLREEERLRVQMRKCRSFKDLEIPGDEYSGEPELQNFISQPCSPREKEMLHNPKFVGSVLEFKRAVKQREVYDNVYAESKPKHGYPMKTCKLVTVKVQTNILELLAIDDMDAHRPARRIDYVSDEEYVEENLDNEYTQGLLNNLLDNFKDVQFKKKRRRLHNNRIQEIPNFEIADILGDFDIDNEGNNVIVRGKDKKLNDREGRKVNRRGYLIDIDGNVITQNGTLIFKKDEIDSDDEIPAPFCFELKKKSLFKIEQLGNYNQSQKKKKLEDKEDDIEREYRKLREKNASNRSSVDSLMGETPNKYNKQNKRLIPGDEDGFLSKIVKPMQAKSKNELLNKIGAALSPTKRSRPANNVSNLDPTATQDTLKTEANQSRSHQNRGSLDSQMEGTQNLFFTNQRMNEQTLNTNKRAQQSTTSYQDFHNLDFSLERISKINRLKEALGNQKEDRMLLKQLEKYEQMIKGPIREDKGKKSLAKQNLSKVYGRVQDKLSIMIGFNKPKVPTQGNKIINQSQLETEDELLTAKVQQNKQPQKPMDSRIKNLENIYMKQQRPNTNMSRQRTLLGKQNSNQWDFSDSSPQIKFRPMQQSFADTTGVESSDQEELRLRQEIDKMEAILNRDTQLQIQSTQRKRAPNHNLSAHKSSGKKGGKKSKANTNSTVSRQLLQGGWI